MDPNRNFYSNMDLSSSGDFQSPLNMQSIQNMTPEQIMLLKQINAQKIQALQLQLAQTTLQNSNAGLPGLDPYVSNFQASSMSPPASVYAPMGHMYRSHVPANDQGHVYSMMPTTAAMPLLRSPITHVPVNSPLNVSINGPVPMTQNVPSSVVSEDYNHMAYPNTSMNINTMTNHSHNQTTRFNNVPDSLPLHNVNRPKDSSFSSSNYSSSAASTPQDSPGVPKKPSHPTDVPNGSRYAGERPRQRVSSPPPIKPPSRKSSTSSASIPGSPGSSGPMSPDGGIWADLSEQLSPNGSPRKMNGDARQAQIKNKPLKMETRYPQDKCYTCLKKVYPMEKLGPVKGVVYHKTCFKCKNCNTNLTLKNFTHSQIDSFDLSVYCKSHQPLSSEKGTKLDTQSFEIKSALQAPKKDVIAGEANKVPVHTYSYDVMCRQIEHARTAPVADLKSGVKARSNAWDKTNRDQYTEFPSSVVKHDTPVAEYHEDEYNRYKIETEPDYT
ncbi:uncharacterized protein LOC127881643 [Dreissena polymorpha]|uniref:LIM zinc-binding domain-containing protein n=1 Tax=Dreissena polymorpha TaxID=45954 RepID=A0A9D4GTH3_DREPO|nr:uncharacterized protein LOC127881643 [Dreissena polymorpha]KAH3819662.1 hypothetical protein DPMN_121404 [Dreissena polymorpha]